MKIDGTIVQPLTARAFRAIGGGWAVKILLKKTGDMVIPVAREDVAKMLAWLIHSESEHRTSTALVNAAMVKAMSEAA
jgi:hypothetical protein